MTNPDPFTDAQDLLATALAERYLIEEELGRGASATVYLAQDLRHGRRVALKVLHSALGAALGVERFQREIRTQARLHHPHILPLYDSGLAAGRLFYAMPHVEAGSLRDRLRRTGSMETSAVVRLAIEVASALAYAHQLGVIHRDLKPENVMLSPTGQAILADFGIAYAVEESTGSTGDAPAGRLTETGITVGTPAYMSPEQAAGDEALTGRSDQYALAALVYEMLAGQPPFTGPNARAILAKKLTSPPPPLRELRPDVPAGTEAVLHRALSRIPAERFESIDGFARALDESIDPRRASVPGTAAAAARQHSPRRRLALELGLAGLLALGLLAGWLASRGAGTEARAAAETGDRVLVVLPFKNLGAPADQYFADGLTEEITSRLASLSGLRVISRTSADQYRTTDKSLREIGAELGAGYVLEGSVRWERADSGPGRIRVTPQLIHSLDDSHLWAESYEVELTEVFRVQSEIAGRVTTALDLALRGPEHASIVAAGTRSAEAYDYYLRGIEYAARSYGRGNVEASINLYRRAVTLDPAFALAWARLARGHAAMYWFYHDRSSARVDSTRAAVEAALRLAPDLPESRVAQGFYYYWGRRDYDRALQEFQAARRQQPSNSELLSAIGYVQRRQGRWDSAAVHFEEALRYDPRSAVRTLDLADARMSMRDYDAADQGIDRAIQLAPDWADPYAYKAMLQLIWRGDRDRARAAVGEALTRISAGRLALAFLSPDGISAALLTSDTVFAPALDAMVAGAFDGDTARYHLVAAEAAWHRGDRGAERAHGDSAAVLLRDQVRGQPDDARLLVRYALALARSGRKPEAIGAAREAAGLLPPSLDANSGPFVQIHLAEIYALLGEAEQAVETLRPLLRLPGWISVPELRSDPTWTPLRDHPRFAELLSPA